MVLVKKAQAMIWRKKFPALRFLSWSVVALENSTNWGLETAVCPTFVKMLLDIFAVCSLVPRINLSHLQKLFMPQKKNQNYVLEKTNLRFFLSYGLRNTKITIFSTFFVIGNFSSFYNRNLCKKIQFLSVKRFCKWKWNLIWNKRCLNYSLYYGKEKQEFLWNSSMKNLEGLLVFNVFYLNSS